MIKTDLVQAALNKSALQHQEAKKREEEALKKAQLEVKFKEEIQYHDPKPEAKIKNEMEEEEDDDDEENDDEDEEDEEDEEEEKLRYLRSKQYGGKR